MNQGYIEAENLQSLSIVEFHSKFYYKYLKNNKVPSQLVIRSEKEVLSSYRTIKSNKQNKTVPIKKALSCRLDKRIYTLKGSKIRLTTLENRIEAQIHLYPKLKEIFEAQIPCDPLIFERDGKIWIALSFKEALKPFTPKLAVGIDLGVRRLAATSEGNVFIDKDFNKRVRNIRFRRRKLQSARTKGSRNRLHKLRRRESRMKKNMLHNLANKILQTSANVLVLEDLSKIKFKKKKRNQTKQTSFFALRQILTYKAPSVNKQVVTVSPYYTSQIDCLTGNLKGERKGIRFYGESILDSDLNAACNIAFRYSQSKIGNKLPVSWRVPLDGQAAINRPIACKSERVSV